MAKSKNTKRLFDNQASDYLKGRPGYPAALFDYLKQRAANHDHALDCATGSGQAVPGLTRIFNQVSAFDVSQNQLDKATIVPNVRYFQSTAEQIAVNDNSVDALTVAEALHWFDQKAFYKEANRVLKPGGLVAAWCYYLPEISPKIDKLVDHYYHDILQPYAAPRREIIKNGYRDIEYPFENVERRVFKTEKDMTFETLLSNLRSSSIAQTFKDAKGYDPVDALEGKLKKAWGKKEVRTAKWDIHCLSGYTKAPAGP